TDVPGEPSQSLRLIPARDSEKLQLSFASGFHTRTASLDQLAFVRIEVVGEEISGILSQDGGGFLPVVGGSVSATVSNIPRKSGKLRVVTLLGYDAAQNPLGAVELAGHYVSTTATALSPVLSRRELLLGRVLRQVLANNPAMLANLDIAGLLAVLDTATGYDPLGRRLFTTDPSRFDAAAVFGLLPAGGSPLPTAGDITANALSALQDVNLSLNTPNGNLLGENINLVLDDPLSKPLAVLSGSADGSPVTIPDVPIGNWTLKAYAADGALLTQTAVSVTNSGAAVTSDPLLLTGVREIVPDFLVNTETNGGQLLPAVAMDADGDFVVVWQTYHAGENQSGIYGQRYNRNGVPQGAEFRVNTETNDNQVKPAVAMEANGDFVVVWESLNQDGFGRGIYAQRFSATGSPVGGEFLVNTTTFFEQKEPAVAMDADGDFVVAWQSQYQDGSGDGLYAQRYSSTGAAVGGEFLVNSETLNGQGQAAVAMADAGKFVIAWTSDNQDGDGRGVYAQLYNSAGGAIGVETRVNSETVDEQFQPVAAMDADGDYVIAWDGYNQDGEYDGVFFQRFTSSGSPAGSETQANSETLSYQYEPSIAMDADGDFTISWTSYNQDQAEGYNYGVFAQRYNPSGNPLGDEFQVNVETAEEQARPVIAMDDDGDFAIVWQSLDQDGSNYGIFGLRFDPLGNPR
ncbi:MAG: hypothetical protein ACAI44_20790, partial [Candidatus Sericytochromatia bacterium]